MVLQDRIPATLFTSYFLVSSQFPLLLPMAPWFAIPPQQLPALRARIELNITLINIAYDLELRGMLMGLNTTLTLDTIRLEER